MSYMGPVGFYFLMSHCMTTPMVYMLMVHSPKTNTRLSNICFERMKNYWNSILADIITTHELEVREIKGF